ncbi:MAG: GNAT family N-acetyltransferase [Lachnospiraceae bacterium]|nr:GNAT family N-acetyltransferase [Lachnospiraceae bacterium]
MEYTILDNKLQADDFIRLFASAGWGELPQDMVEAALTNSYATFSVESEDKVIAMARLLGDGAMSFFLKDLVVEPEYQGSGIGRVLLTHVEEYIRAQLNPGWEGYLQLVSAKGKEEFYQKLGYAVHPHEHSGPGMSKWIK